MFATLLKNWSRRWTVCVTLHVIFTCRDFLNIPSPASRGINITKCIHNKLLVVTFIFMSGRDILKFLYCRDPSSLCCFGSISGLHERMHISLCK